MPPAARRPADIPYADHPAIAHEAAGIRSLVARTGRTLDEWIAIGRQDGPAEERALAHWLQHTHGLGRDTARWVAGRSLGSAPSYDPGALVDTLFSGPKAALRPVYDALLAEALALGDDVTITPATTMVPFRRRRVIAQAKPSTRTRVDFGLALGKHAGALPERLLDTGGAAKGDRITHRIALASPDDVDDVVRHWLRVAYDLDA